MDQTACQYDAEPVHSQSVHYHTDYFPLLELPPELLLRVCDFIDSTTVITQLGSVCKSLRELMNDDLIWKMRIRRRWPGKRYPPSFNSIPADFDWKQACMSREDEYRKWKSAADSVIKADLSVSHSCIDSVHINQQNNLLALGCRDHSLVVLNTKHLPTNDSVSSKQLESHCAFQNQAHNGWVWTVSSSSDRLCSGGWDSKLKLWDFDGTEISSYRCSSPVLCSHTEGHETLAGTMVKMLVKVDDRLAEPVTSKRVTAKAVLCMQVTKRWLILGLETRTIHIFDKDSLKLCNVAKCPTGYPKSMCLFNHFLYVGSRDGSLNLYEFDDRLGKLTFIETLQEGDDRRMEVRSVQATLGSVLTANKDGTCKVWEPSSQPSLLATLTLGSEICDMSYSDGLLAVGLSNGIVSIYRGAQSP